MEEEELEVILGNSARSTLGKLIVSYRGTLESESGIELVVGRPGLPNRTANVDIGDAFLFETPDAGLLEVRLLALRLSDEYADVLVTQVSPRLGLAGGYVGADPANEPFTQDELERIESSVERLKEDIAKSLDLEPERLSLLLSKLDEVKQASTRLGRKDWINYAVGMLTGAMTNIALETEQAKTVMSLANRAFSWLFTGAIELLPF